MEISIGEYWSLDFKTGNGEKKTVLPNILLLCIIKVVSVPKTVKSADQHNLKSARKVEHKLSLATGGDNKLFTFIILNMFYVLL